MNPKVRNRILVGTGLAFIVSASALIASKWAPGGSGASVVAYPATVSEKVVIDALAASGFKTVIAASTLRIPMSDFSRVIEIPVRSALNRAPSGDPRRTPLLDRLESRFFVRGPDGARWSALYIQDGASSRQGNLAGTMDALETPYAIGSMRGTERVGYTWLPVLIWLAWLVIRKPGGDRLLRLAWLVPWLPLLFGATAESAFLVLLLECAAIMARSYLAGGMSGPLAARLAPIGFSVIALLAFDTGMLPKLGMAAGLFMLSSAVAPYARLFSRRKWLHEPPVFKPLTKRGAALSFRSVMVSAVFPSVAIIILSLAMPAEYHDDTGRGAGLSIERGSAEAKPDEKTLVSSHLAFQRALTYGRLGEAVWGESDFSDAFRYESVDGRIRRASATGRAGRDDDGSHDSGDLAFVLAEPQLLGISRR